MSTEGEYKLLNELRVTELKAELDKRGLDKNGIKIILTDRLEKALKAEGHDPTTYKFCVSEIGTPLTSPSKPKDDVKSEIQSDNVTSANGDPTPDEHEPISESKLNDPENAEENENMEQDNMETEVKKSPEQDDQSDDPLREPSAEDTSSFPKSQESTQVTDPSLMFWVRGLNPTTRAADLRELFSQYGKVARAKIFTSKRVPGKTFGLVTVNDPEMVDKCYNAQHNKQWNGTTITIDKGNVSTMSSKTTAAANATVAKKETSKVTVKDENKSETKKDEKDSKESTRTTERKSSDKEREREREKGDADRTRSRRDPIREPRRDSRKTISAARRPPVVGPRSSIRAPPSITTRLSRPGTSLPRRVESYGRSDPDRDRQRAREEDLRRRAAEKELEVERERLRAEREKIEREKLELQLMQQKAQLAAYEKAAHGPSRGHHSESSRHGSTSSSRRDDKYPSRSGGDGHRPHDRSSARDRERTSRTDDRRPPPASNGDRSRSRHDNHREAGHRDSRFGEQRRDGRHDASTASRSISSGYNGGRNYSNRDAPSNITSGQNFYGSRESYSSGVRREYDHGARVAPAAGSWSGTGGGNWTAVTTDNNWGMKNTSGTGGWGYGSNPNPSNVRIDYDKYHRQSRQF